MSLEILEDNTDEVINGIRMAIVRGLEKAGMLGESYAKANITKNGSVVTGRLRASIMYSVDGEDAVYIGTNTEYAPFVELGTSRMKRPKPYLRPAATDHAEEYREVFRSELNS